MSALAKVFVVIVLILTVAFTGTTATLYSGRDHYKKVIDERAKAYEADVKSWGEKNTAQLGTIERQQKDISSQQAALASLQATKESLDRDVERLSSENAKLASDYKTALDRNTEKDGHLQQKDQEIGRLTKNNEDLTASTQSAVKSEQDAKVLASRTMLDNEQLAKVVEDLRKEVASLKKDGDDMSSALARLKEQNPRAYEEVIVSSKPPPPIDGQIVAVRPETGIVVVSIGQEDKLESGVKLTVYRGDKFIGKVQTTKVAADMAGAEILYLDGDAKIQVGDQVTTRIGN